VSVKTRTPVVFAAGASGSLIHELIGHPAEGDIAVGIAVQSKSTAIEEFRVVDRSKVGSGWADFVIDDEGTEAKDIVIFDSGSAKGTLDSIDSARLAQRKPNGRGRRANYRSSPMARAMNTEISRGMDDPSALRQDAAGVLEILQIAGGDFHTETGEFSLVASAALFHTPSGNVVPIRGARVSGNTVETIARIVAIANDFERDNLTCLKAGQAVGVTVGGPSIRIDDLEWRTDA
jgi:TldD protein